MINRKEVNKRFGAAIKDARRIAQLSQQDLAAQLRVTRASISMIEAGAQSVSVPTLLEISQALKVSAADLLAALAPEPQEDISRSSHAARASEIRRKYMNGETTE